MPEQVRTDAGAAQQHRLAIDHERRVPIAQCRLGDQRIAVAPVVAIAREQPHALVLALDNQPVAVVLDLVNPFRSVGDFRRLGRNARLER